MSEQTASNYPPALMGWYVVIVLALANAVSFIDRLILTLLVPALKAEFALSDTKISLLQGFAFALFYSVMGLPIARWADAHSRKWLITVGVAFWSLMTAVCGLAKGFWSLFAARVGVGVGEATLSPSAYSMMSDYFPPQRLALPVGVFSAGVSAGMGLAFIAGAAAIQAVAAMGTVDLPLIGPIGGWRLVFVLVGSIGIVVIALMLTVKEPPRQVDVNDSRESIPVREVLAYFVENWRIYTLTMVGYGLTAVSVYGIINWTPVFYIRSFGISAPEAGYLIGVVALAGGISGALAGGAIADRWANAGDRTAKLKVLFICCLGLIPAGVISPLMPTLPLALGVLFFTFFFGTAAAGPTGSFIQVITPPRMRAQFGALYQLSLSLVGLGVGPVIVALFTDFVFADESMVRYSIASVVALVNPFAALFAWLAWRYHRTQVQA